jgi:hypothetical protein
MMSRQLPVLFAALVLLVPSIVRAGVSGPSNYDECITDTMKGVSSDVAAHAIIESCRNLFPEPQPDAAPQAAVPAAASEAPVPENARDLTADELGRLRSRAKVFGSHYRVTIDNDNPDLTLTEVTIAVWDEGNPVASRKEYSEAVHIAPRESALVKYTVHYRGEETGWSWGVVGARGVE